MILGEYITVKEMVAIEMNAEALGVSTQLMMENAWSTIPTIVLTMLIPQFMVHKL